MELASNYGIVSLIPVTVVIVTAVISKKTVEPLILGALVGYVILYKASFLLSFSTGLQKSFRKTPGLYWYLGSMVW